MTDNEIETLTTEILAYVQHLTKGALSPQDRASLREAIIVRMLDIRDEAGRAWLGRALTRGRGDD